MISFSQLLHASTTENGAFILRTFSFQVLKMVVTNLTTEGLPLHNWLVFGTQHKVYQYSPSTES